jgi:hypothetical protein
LQELANCVKGPAKKSKAAFRSQGMLSQKLDAMKDAKIDGELMSSLGNSIKILNQLQKSIAPTAESMASTKKW